MATEDALFRALQQSAQTLLRQGPVDPERDADRLLAELAEIIEIGDWREALRRRLRDWLAATKKPPDR